MAKSLHIIGDFYDCQTAAGLLVDAALLKKKIIPLIKKAGFGVVGQIWRQFPGGGGVTGLVLVSESHLAIHTWPEKAYLTVDVFFCNYNQDNSEKVKMVFEGLAEMFQPAKIKRRHLRRD